MKTRYFVLIVVVLGLVGCGSQNNSLPQFAKSIPIASIDDGERLVTYNEDLDLVCVENASKITGSPERAYSAAFSCWGVDTASKKIQELIRKHKNVCDVGLSC